jgi:hypothetical protein
MRASTIGHNAHGGQPASEGQDVVEQQEHGEEYGEAYDRFLHLTYICRHQIWNSVYNI